VLVNDPLHHQRHHRDQIKTDLFLLALVHRSTKIQISNDSFLKHINVCYILPFQILALLFLARKKELSYFIYLGFVFRTERSYLDIIRQLCLLMIKNTIIHIALSGDFSQKNKTKT